jgi:hypothetical protein
MWGGNSSLAAPDGFLIAINYYGQYIRDKIFSSSGFSGFI